MRSLVTVAVTLGCLLAGTARAAAQEPAPKEELVDQVRQAIERGQRFLRQQERGKGNWENDASAIAVMMKGGWSCLAMLALMYSGVPPDDPIVQRGLTWLRAHQFDSTYVVGLQTMVYAEAGYAEDKPRIQQNVNWLIRAMSGRGPTFRGWSYDAHPGMRTDNSNSQYALLGLWAAKTAGVDVPAAIWNDIRDYYLRTQQPDGGWFYEQSRTATTLTMTTAGFCGLLISGMELAKGQQMLQPDGTARRCGVYVENEPLARALSFIGSDRNFTLQPRMHQFYNIYGIERAGRLSGRRFFGGHDWYREGCKLLVKMQHDDGSWSVNNGQLTDNWPVVSTSFALLFLAKGRTPVLISKFATGPLQSEDWNRKHNGVRHLVEFASRELFKKTPLAWQVYDARQLDQPTEATIRREVSELLVSPLVFMNGHEKPVLTDLQKQILKKYLEEGGFLFAEACCGSKDFTQGFKALMEELFPDAPLRPLPPEHPIWHSAFAVPPTAFPDLMGIDMGCKTVVVFSPRPLAGWYEENEWDRLKYPTSKGPMAFRLAGNIIAYATGMEIPKPKLSKVDLPEEGPATLRVKRGYLKAGQLRHEGDWQPAPRAMRNLLASLSSKDQLDVALQTEPLRPLSPDLYQFKFLYLHGRGQFSYTAAECEALRADLKTGGLLFADACCGKKPFDAAFRAFAKQLFPGQPLQRIPLDDPLFSAELNGTAITTVRCRRERADGSGPEPEFRTVAPLLEGIKYNGRWVVIYSRYDIGCALEKHQSTDCMGHDHESALRLGRAAVLYMLKR